MEGGVLVASIPDLSGTQAREVFVDGRRHVQARWPNANPEVVLFPGGYEECATWGPFADLGQGKHVTLRVPNRTKDSGGGGNHFDYFQYFGRRAQPPVDDSSMGCQLELFLV